jgi:hypothetical protein
MKWLKKFEYFRESLESQTHEKPSKSIYSNKNLVSEICVAMVLLNNEFLDNILDRGLKSRYSENSQVFITDLKNLLMAKNRLKIGKFVDNKCVEDNDFAKINSLFNSADFSIEKDWNKLVDARNTARNIIDKLLPDDKLRPEQIRFIFWIGPNKDKEHSEDIVVELEDGRQFSFFLNKNLSMSKTASFNKFADDLIGTEIENLYSGEYISKWSKLVQSWCKIIYENVNKKMQINIEKFIDPKRIDTIGYFEYFDIKHRDPRFKILGELIPEFDKNILKLSDLMSEIWKHRDSCFMDVEQVYTRWMETKIFILNSKILEHLLTESLTKNNIDEITKLEDGFKLAEGSVKMKLVKTLVEKMGCLERPIYYLGNSGNNFHQVPSRQFFRDFYDDLTVKFDYHVKMIIDKTDEENNDFTIKINLELDNEPLINCLVSVKFSGGEMSGKLSAKYKFEPVSDFNLKIANKMSGKSKAD